MPTEPAEIGLFDLRRQIDAVDDQILDLFTQRMRLTQAVGEYKKLHQLPILQSGREEQVLEHARTRVPDEFGDGAALLFTTLMEISKSGQKKLAAPQINLSGFEGAAKMLNQAAPVACQGVPGAYSQAAAKALFHTPAITFFHSFDEVFAAVEDGRCEYGVLPIENSSAGSVSQVYDLLGKTRFSICASAKIPIRHSLLAKPGVPLGDITDLYSHEQALLQSSRFLKEHPGIRPHIFSNTAAAAEFVASSPEKGVAALACGECAGLYGLQKLIEGVQDFNFNFTRFICISKHPVVEPDADKISLLLRLEHRAGTLFQTLQEFASRQINLLKLESRPIPETNFEFTFYFDFEGSLIQPQVRSLLAVLEEKSTFLQLLGNYREY